MKNFLKVSAISALFFLCGSGVAQAAIVTCYNTCSPNFSNYEGSVVLNLQCNASSPASYTGSLTVNGVTISYAKSCVVAPTINLTATPSTISYGGATTISWSTANASSCWASGDWTNGWIAGSGSAAQYSLIANKSFTMECWNSAGVSSGPKTARVAVTPPPVPTISINASPSTISSGSSTTVNWTTTGATSCWASGDWTNGWKRPNDSEIQSNVTAAKSFTLECWNAAGVSSSPRTTSVCVSNNCAQNTCTGKTCNNGCATVPGIKTPTNPNCNQNICKSVSCFDGCSLLTGLKDPANTCEKDTCVGQTCDNGCNPKTPGTKDCRDNSWQEVSPN